MMSLANATVAPIPGVTFRREDAARAARLRQLYRLTPGETRITLLVAQKMTTREIAETLEISVNTVRSHLRSIFVKCEVPGQPALRRLVEDLS